MKTYTILIYILSLISPPLFAQAIPPITNYTTTDYGADNQNWDITQSDEGIIYIANNKGLVSYNGEQWSVYSSPNQTILRSVYSYGGDIYTGAHMDFGFWSYNKNGKLNYKSIVKELNVKMFDGEEVWEILTFQNKIIFQSLRRLFVYDTENESVKIINISKNPLDFRLFKVDNLLVYQVLGEGLYTLKNGLPELYNSNDVFKSNRFINLFSSSNNWIGITRNNGIYQIYKNQEYVNQSKTISALVETPIYSAIQLRDKSIALGTVSKGLIKMTPNGELEYQIGKNNGLHNNTILSLFQDRDSNLWLGLDNGLSIINMNSELRVYSDQPGLLGTIYTSTIHNNYIYIGTNQGLFYKEKNIGDFKMVSGTSEQVWSLKVINGELFCGHNKGTFVVDGGEARLIASEPGTWDILEVPNTLNFLIQGNYDGLYILQKIDGKWVLKNKIKGFDSSSKHFAFADDRKILVNNEYKGVYEVTIDSSLSKVSSVKLNTTVSKGEHSSIQKFDGHIYYASKKGFFRYNTISSTFVKNDQITNYFKDEYLSGKLINDQHGSLWIFTINKILKLSKSLLNERFSVEEFYIPEYSRNMNKGYENLSVIDDSGYLIGTSNGYLLFEPKLKSKNRQVSIASVSLKERDGGLMELPTKGDITLDSDQNSLSFGFSTLTFQKYSKAQFQYRLVGFYDEWSKWTYDSWVEFSNIPPGDYRFEVRSNEDSGTLAKNAYYRFTIDKPWYKSNIAIVLYLLGFLLLFGILQWLSNRYFDKKRQMELNEARKELTLKSIHVEKENVKLKNANLESEIEARNRELATITMGMVERNRTLNSIKDSLLKLDQTLEITSVIKEIDLNLSKDQDWNEFEKAFNRADKDFFNSVREKHPNLTSNDFKLCVYLRLNMSSKEIAPLLNISYRSVEIKRYRLRKKLNLDRSVSLNEYFMEL